MFVYLLKLIKILNVKISQGFQPLNILVLINEYLYLSVDFGMVLSFQDIAAYIKKEFDKKYNPTWHCIVGRNFGSYVTHETRHFIYFYLGQVAILLFKSG